MSAQAFINWLIRAQRYFTSSINRKQQETYLNVAKVIAVFVKSVGFSGLWPQRRYELLTWAAGFEIEIAMVDEVCMVKLEKDYVMQLNTNIGP